MRVPVLCISLAWVSAFGRQPEKNIADRCDTQMVFWEAAVTDGPGGEAIRGLSRADFQLYDNGRAEDIIACEPLGALQIILVVDKGSLVLVRERAFWSDLKKALLGLNGHDRVALLRLDYGDIRWLHDFTSDPKPVLDLLTGDKTQPRLQSMRQPVFDALAEAARKFQTANACTGWAIIVLSNDRERDSQLTPEGAIEQVLKANAGVYHAILDNVGGGVTVVGLPWPLPRPEIRGPRPPWVPSVGMARVVRRTGGEQVAASASRKTLSTLLGRLRNQYVLSYKRPPYAGKGEFRTVSVQLSEAVRRRYPGAVVRTRAGYYATD